MTAMLALSLWADFFLTLSNLRKQHLDTAAWNNESIKKAVASQFAPLYYM